MLKKKLTMMKIEIKLLLLLTAALISGFMISSVFRKNDSIPESLYKDLVAAKEQTIKAMDVTIKAKESEKEAINEMIEHHYEQDSILLDQFKSNQLKYSANDKKLYQVRSTVPSLSREELRREFSNY